MRRSWLPVLCAVGFLGFWVVMAVVPAKSLPTPGCTIRKWTGVHCPGCGGTRAARHLVHGRPLKAARSNVLIYPFAMAALWGVVAMMANAYGGRRWWTPVRISARAAMWLLLVAAVFTLIRNLEWGWFLRP